MARILPFGFLSPSSVSLVDGSDGDLVVVNGQTFQITAGSIKSYNSIDVQAGGILEITGAEAITQIGCKGNFIVNGTFRGKTTENVANRSLVSDNWLGLPFSYSQSQSAGGQGGTSYSWGQIGPAQSNGNGGGGSGGYCNVNTYKGGFGGTGESNGLLATNLTPPEFSTNIGIGNQGGHGGPVNWEDNSPTSQAQAQIIGKGANGGGGGGGAGVYTDFKGSFLMLMAGGAGGGGRGAHGRGVYILAEIGISGTGSVDFSGDVGFNATQFYTTAAANTSTSTRFGGGGGGGAGGAGGSVWIRHFSGVVTPTINIGGGGGGSRSKFQDQQTLSPASERHPKGFCYGFISGGAPANTLPTHGSAGGNGVSDIQII